MKKDFIVVWIREGFYDKQISIINEMETEQQAVDEVHKLHVCSKVLYVGILSNNWEKENVF